MKNEISLAFKMKLSEVDNYETITRYKQLNIDRVEFNNFILMSNLTENFIRYKRINVEINYSEFEELIKIVDEKISSLKKTYIDPDWLEILEIIKS
jgi:hypothetical protein